MIIKETSEDLALSKSHSINILLKSKEIPNSFTKKFKQLLALSGKSNTTLNKKLSTKKSKPKINTPIEPIEKTSDNIPNNKSEDGGVNIKFNLLKGITNGNGIQNSDCGNGNIGNSTPFLNDLIPNNSVVNQPKVNNNSNEKAKTKIKSSRNKISEIEKSKIGNFYGNSNIEIWEDNSDDEGNTNIKDLIKKQLKFVHTNSINIKVNAPRKDEYDVDYDKGKVKKVKKKTDRFSKGNKFQDYQNQN